MDLFKVVLVGDSGVGKTSILQQFSFGCFKHSNPSTTCAMLLTKSLEIPEENATIKFALWDTAGQEKYRNLTSIYYRDAAAVIIVYDITKMESFENSKLWLEEVKEKVKPNTIISLVGNKTDMIDNEEVDIELANGFADENGLKFHVSSAKSDNGIKDIFIEIGRELLQRKNPNTVDGRTSLKNNTKKSNHGCCK